LQADGSAIIGARTALTAIAPPSNSGTTKVTITGGDGQTAVTDRAGRFFLESDTAGGYGSNFYTITVTSGATTRDFGPYSGDQPRQQQYNMN
jgi:hypothetical protein